MAFRGEFLFTPGLRPSIYLCNKSWEISIKKVSQKYIYARFLGTVCCCSSPNKVAHVWRFTFNHKSSDGAFRPPRCSCPLNDTRNRGMGVGILRNGWGWHGAKCFHSQTRLPQDLPQPMHPPFLFTSLS